MRGADDGGVPWPRWGPLRPAHFSPVRRAFACAGLHEDPLFLWRRSLGVNCTKTNLGSTAPGAAVRRAWRTLPPAEVSRR
jgi:hypothetical protein